MQALGLSSICHALITRPMRLLIVSRNKKTEMLINSRLVDKGLQGTSKDAYPLGIEGFRALCCLWQRCIGTTGRLMAFVFWSKQNP